MREGRRRDNRRIRRASYLLQRRKHRTCGRRGSLRGALLVYIENPR
jgi:hypothetical protein